mmetsp:Transcript_3061/g.5791  ORF Transcript_3061/g.5791 Transcript_3061/m.5791 type:complete len:80 (-) Transcript_3061:49-288(-)
MIQSEKRKIILFTEKRIDYTSMIIVVTLISLSLKSRISSKDKASRSLLIVPERPLFDRVRLIVSLLEEQLIPCQLQWLS